MRLDHIYQEDCLEVMKDFPDNSVDLVLTDPPYGINYYSNYYEGENPHEPIKNDDSLFIPLDKCWRVLKPSGAMFIFYSHKVPLIDKRVKNRIIWVKNNHTAGDLEGNFANKYECIAFLPKESFELNGYRYTNVWKFDRVPPHKLRHPTEKPVALIRRIIKSSTEKDDVVLDPFLGSGTTAVACKQLGRKYIGIELEEEYVEIANKRLEQKTLHEIMGSACDKSEKGET